MAVHHSTAFFPTLANKQPLVRRGALPPNEPLPQTHLPYLQHFFDRLLHFPGSGRGGKPLDGLAVFVDYKFREVPLDPAAQQPAGELRFQKLENGVGIFAVDLHLFEHGEADAVVELAKFLNVRRRAGLLIGELVAGEPQDVQAFVPVLLVQLLQPLVLRGEAAFTGGIDHHYGLAFVGAHRDGLALDGLGF